MKETQEIVPSTVVGQEIALAGQMGTDQPLGIRGIFEGDLEAASTVVVGAQGLVSANLTAEHVIVQGVVVGNIRAEWVEIQASARVWGNICAQTLYIEPGALVCGQIRTPCQAEYVLSPPSFDEPSGDAIVLPFRPPPKDDLDRLVAELEFYAQSFEEIDDPLLPAESLDVRRAVARVAQAKNEMIFQLQLELQALQAALEEQEALLETRSTEEIAVGNGRETELIRQNARLCRRLKNLQTATLQRQQGMTRLQMAHDELLKRVAEYKGDSAELVGDAETQPRDEYDVLQAKVAQLTSEVHLAQQQGQQLSNDLTVTYRRLQELETERDALQATVAQLKGDLGAAKVKGGKARADVTQLEAEIADLKAELEASHARIEQLAADRGDGEHGALEESESLDPQS